MKIKDVPFVPFMAFLVSTYADVDAPTYKRANAKSLISYLMRNGTRDLHRKIANLAALEALRDKCILSFDAVLDDRELGDFFKDAQEYETEFFVLGDTSITRYKVYFGVNGNVFYDVLQSLKESEDVLSKDDGFFEMLLKP